MVNNWWSPGLNPDMGSVTHASSHSEPTVAKSSQDRDVPKGARTVRLDPVLERLTSLKIGLLFIL